MDLIPLKPQGLSWARPIAAQQIFVALMQQLSPGALCPLPLPSIWKELGAV